MWNRLKTAIRLEKPARDVSPGAFWDWTLAMGPDSAPSCINWVFAFLYDKTLATGFHLLYGQWYRFDFQTGWSPGYKRGSWKRLRGYRRLLLFQTASCLPPQSTCSFMWSHRERMCVRHTKTESDRDRERKGEREPWTHNADRPQREIKREGERLELYPPL